MATKARGQITIVDLNDGRSVNMYLGANRALTQIYDSTSSSSQFTPNYPTENLVITPELYVSGISGNQISQCSKGTWTINGSTNIASFGGSQGGAQPYALTINKNMTDVSQLRIEYSTDYTDSETGLTTTVKANINLVKVNNAGNACVAVMYAPDGTTISKNASGAINQVKLHCDLWRGSAIDNTDVTYQWQILSSGSWVNVTDGTNYSGATTNELTVQADGVTNFEVFKCIITDTDSGSATKNKTFAATMTVIDSTDIYSVEISSTTGNVLTKTATSTTLKANVWQNGQMLSDTAHNNITYAWTKYDKDGANGVSAGTTRSITVGKSDISVRATFVCEVTI